MTIIKDIQKDQIASHLEVLRYNLALAKDKFPEMYRGKIPMWEYEILLHELALESFIGWRPLSEKPTSHGIYIGRDADGQMTFSNFSEYGWESAVDSDCGALVEWYPLP